MPTSLRRHSITETPRVEAALAELRELIPGQRLDLGELVVLGARRKAEEFRAGEARRQDLLNDLAERVLRGDLGIDPAAAAEVRERGWARG